MPNPKRMSIACGTHSLVGRLSVSSDRLFRHLVPTQSLRESQRPEETFHRGRFEALLSIYAGGD
jgi:hypothetical protein